MRVSLPAIVRDVTARIEKIAAGYPPPEMGPEASHPHKYLDAARWVDATHRRALGLRLDAGGGLRILDIGSGVGYFAFVCAKYGHQTICLDHPKRPDMYREVCTALGVTVEDAEVSALLPLPPLGTFDLITAQMVTFNNHGKPDVWGPDEWGFFLRDCFSRLRPGGRVCLELNREADGRCYNRALERAFIGLGAEITGHYPHQPEDGGHRLLFRTRSW
jgi:SAM-dependent methyltransferase